MMKCLSTLIHSLNTYFTSFYFQNLKKQKYLFTSIVLRSSSYSTKIALKWTKIMLQSSVISIWNPQNQGYKIGNIYNYWDQPWSPKNGLEMLLRILSANTVHWPRSNKESRDSNSQDSQHAVRCSVILSL